MSESSRKNRVAVHTLGCKLNYAETSTIAKEFVDRGYVVVPLGEQTDVFLLNTCSVTENAERECRQLIRRTLRKSPEAFVAVTGCYAQLRPEEIAKIDGVDLVLGSGEKFNLFERESEFKKRDQGLIVATETPELIEFHAAATSESDSRTRAFLKVQDGCDYSCSYCTIPQARGASRSGSIASVVSEARRLSEEGFREIVLSGVNVGDFGSGSAETFFDLVHALEKDREVTARIRISSIEPNLLKNEIVDLVADSSKFCPHFHIPLQSGSPKILRLMQRRYNRELYTSRIASIRQRMPNACIGVDVIVGFPGETDYEFTETLLYLSDLDFSYLHVFTFSERPDTRAATMEGSVPLAVRRERNHMLRELSARKTRAFYESQLGREAIVVMESREDGGWISGYTENYVRVAVASTEGVDVDLARVRLDRIADGVVHASVRDVLARTTSSMLLPIVC